MSLKGIIAVTGKPGLYKIISQSKTGLIVESLEDKKRIPVYANNKVSALEDIRLYTYEDEVPIFEIFKKLYEKNKGEKSVSHKESPEVLKKALKEVQENYDEERVYNSDLKKLFQWYNILITSGELKEAIEQDEKEKKAEKDKKDKTPQKSKKTASKTSKPEPTAKSNKKPTAAKVTRKASTPRKSS